MFSNSLRCQCSSMFLVQTTFRFQESGFNIRGGKIFDFGCSCTSFCPPFNGNFEFLKNCLYDFNKLYHSHSAPKGTPTCAMTSNLFGWDQRKIGKSSTKVTKNGQFYFSIFLKILIQFQQKFLHSFYTILGSYVCNDIKIV